MAAKKGNKYAEKYTKKEVLRLINVVYVYAQNNSSFYLNTVLRQYDLYAELWSIWKRRFEADNEVLQAIKRVEDLIQENLYNGALINRFNPTMAIFGLKNNWGWKDKIEQNIDHTTQGQPLSINITKTYKKEIDK